MYVLQLLIAAQKIANESYIICRQKRPLLLAPNFVNSPAHD